MPVVRRGFVRQRRSLAHGQGGGSSCRCSVGGAVCEAVAHRADAAARRDAGPAGSGTPQGSAVSPVLANLFMHYAFDAWMTREYPGIRFERFADDVVVHCVTERQARNLVAAIGDRMEQVGLRLHPDKTKVVYCQDGKRRLDRELTAFTFLGFTFRARRARTKHGKMFVSFQPAIST